MFHQQPYHNRSERLVAALQIDIMLAYMLVISFCLLEF
jgi:hypothetical protein